EVYHLACPTSPKNFDRFRRDTLLANSVGMVSVLDLAARYGARFFQASSSVVYGLRPSDGHPLREDEHGSFDHLTPRGCYDEGKRFAETACATYRDVQGLDVRIGRIFRTYGPRQPLEDGHMVPDFVLDAIDGRDMVIYGDENFRSSLIYVTDVVDAIVRLMELPEDPGPVNIGSDYDIRLSDVAKKIQEMVGSTSKIVYKERLPFMRELGLPDLVKAKGIGWLPLMSLEQGLKKTIEYAVAHRDILRPSFGQ
ncbi:MAG: NAD-dependent epimerase/dehydratase family protein, partial [bacterium]